MTPLDLPAEAGAPLRRGGPPPVAEAAADAESDPPVGGRLIGYEPRVGQGLLIYGDDWPERLVRIPRHRRRPSSPRRPEAASPRPASLPARSRTRAIRDRGCP